MSFCSISHQSATWPFNFVMVNQTQLGSWTFSYSKYFLSFLIQSMRVSSFKLPSWHETCTLSLLMSFTKDIKHTSGSPSSAFHSSLISSSDSESTSASPSLQFSSSFILLNSSYSQFLTPPHVAISLRGKILTSCLVALTWTNIYGPSFWVISLTTYLPRPHFYMEHYQEPNLRS